MITLLLQIQLVKNISCLRIDLIWTNAKNARHQGGNFDKCPAKKKKTKPTTNKQNATLLHLQYLLAKMFFQNRVDGWHPNILLSTFKSGPLTLFLSWKIKRIFYLNLPPVAWIAWIPTGFYHPIKTNKGYWG